MIKKLKKILDFIRRRFEAYSGDITRETFYGELNYESSKVFYLMFIGMFIMLPYIPSDLIIFPFPRFLVSVKAGFSLLCIILVALRFTKRFMHKPNLLLTIMVSFL